MLEEVLTSIHNWFEHDAIYGHFEIKGGSFVSFPPGFIADGQYFKVVGSVFNDGLHAYPASDLEDEEFEGAVYALAVPKRLIALADEIEQWVAKHPASEYTSESFGGYSYTKAVDGTGAPMGWKGAFRSRLNEWRKL